MQVRFTVCFTQWEMLEHVPDNMNMFDFIRTTKEKLMLELGAEKLHICHERELSMGRPENYPPFLVDDHDTVADHFNPEIINTVYVCII